MLIVVVKYGFCLSALYNGWHNCVRKRNNMIPSYSSIDEASGDEQFYCTPCAIYRSRAQFYEKHIQGRKRKCRDCCQGMARMYQKKTNSDPVLRLLRRLRTREHKKFGRDAAAKLDANDVRHIFEVWGKKSFITGKEADLSALTVVAVDNSKPIAISPVMNAVVVSTAEAQRLNKSESSRRWNQFGDDVEKKLLASVSAC